MDWQRFAERIGVMAHDLLEQPSVDATLGRITGSATELVAGCDAAGILVLSGTESASLAPTEPLVTELDQLQRKLGQGPCFDTARHPTGERVFRIADFTEGEPRWADFVAEARKWGVGSMMGFLLYTEDEDFGALNFYSRSPGAFSEESERAGVLLASHAAVALSAARTHAQMEQALATRHQIGQAMGILMARHNIPENEAFNRLRAYSQNHNVKLREVAVLVCEQGALP
ncbi:Response regulator with putative antiterminator output domain [Streptomyces sp. MnatMP-M77]|uniref:GAF and ANTAR domain-containing protein n=1 Tax=unclassified Streptomyces TaxID=2593676 RepID=UPI0008059C53|nr:GAF and ANTAR domain-containing protein [Streptomyces sp. MnatMP-M77]MYT80915.1 ANTAR domain-containing protein [Streptomyces sp. SID8364]SBV06119.1 Response regulator with putative antiterminator output domain [Streptomyces sp. MnatMP-M77]